MRLLSISGVALIGVLGLDASRAWAQAPSADDADASSSAARSQYNAGTKAFADQRYAEAALAFEAAADAKASGVALFTAALSWDRTNAPDRAADDFARALAIPGLPLDKLVQAKERLSVLEGTLGAVSVTGPEGTRVQLDANSERPVPATLHGSSGVHTLTVRPPGGPIERRSVVLERSQTTTLDLSTAPAATPSAVPPPPPTPAPVAPRSGGDWKRPVGIAAIGVGGATLLAGVLLAFEAVDAKNAYTAAPAHATYDHASALATWTDVAFVAGGLFTAGGIALVFWPRPTAGAEVSAWPGGLRIKGVF